MNVICGSCQVTNRISLDKLGENKAKCGKCGVELSVEAPGFVLEVDQAGLSDELKKAKLPILLDLWSPSCPPCRQLAPVLEKLAKEKAGKLRVLKLNTQQNPIAAQAFKLRGVPTLILFKDSQEAARTVGFQPLEALRKFVAES